MKKLTLFLAIVLMVACNASLATKGKDGEPGKPGVSGNGYKILAQSENAGLDKESYHIAYSEKDIRVFTKEWNLTELLKTDFEKNIVVFIFMGQKNTGGYSIGVADVVIKDDTAYIKTMKTSPTGMATMAITNPYCIVEIPKAENVVVEF